MHRHIDWKRDVTLWTGVPRGRDGEYHVAINVRNGRNQFEARLYIQGEVIHQSEHSCICEAKSALREAVDRADRIRGDE